MISCLSKYRETVDPNSPKVVLLSPAGTEGRISPSTAGSPQSGANVKVPDRETLWTLESGTALTPATPVTINWDNGQGLVFRRTFSLDNDYMFKVVDEVENKTTADVALLPYARVYRYGHPKSQAFYILHEGLIGVAGDQGLQELTYADAIKARRAENVRERHRRLARHHRQVLGGGPDPGPEGAVPRHDVGHQGAATDRERRLPGRLSARRARHSAECAQRASKPTSTPAPSRRR